MDVERLIGSVLRGTLSGGRKRSHRARSYLGGGGGSFLNASTLLTLGGLVWGAIETMQQQGAAPAPTPAPRPGTPPPATTPPAGAPPLPLPQPPAGAPPPDAGQAVPDGAATIVRLMVSAARADGDLSETERTTILEHARAAGAEALVAGEIGRPTPLARIVEGVTDPRQRADLYVLAFGIVRGDETVSGAERIYLAQLAALLDLEPASVEQLEREAAARIDGIGQGTDGV